MMKIKNKKTQDIQRKKKKKKKGCGGTRVPDQSRSEGRRGGDEAISCFWSRHKKTASGCDTTWSRLSSVTGYVLLDRSSIPGRCRIFIFITTSRPTFGFIKPGPSLGDEAVSPI
ncbi:hypothetical protein L798_11596 [Zootermopsis nevadensis]|uniref:Uncharacterized protein n=1 Tax=Zootermopsis nevadensis TaxID=136037 RepID=A0A067QVH0_ZOONE|nr:hypothetical protein L798_11596 [Zootermopsis nevadensis]